MKKDSEWNSLAYWQSGEWQVVEERLTDYEKAGISYTPSRGLLFHSLDCISPENVRAVICGQDPYPNPAYATGIAFSVPETIGSGSLPPSLKNIFKEYETDLHYPTPKNGDLTNWVKQGVLLWNVYPSCLAWKPGSNHWDEWRPLTEQILEKIDAENKGVFILLGSCARSYMDCIRNNSIIESSHPSPLGANHGFLGSRIFSRANIELVKLGVNPIDWKLQ